MTVTVTVTVTVVTKRSTPAIVPFALPPFPEAERSATRPKERDRVVRVRGRLAVLRRSAPDANGESSAYVPPVQSTAGVMARPPVRTARVGSGSPQSASGSSPAPAPAPAPVR